MERETNNTFYFEVTNVTSVVNLKKEKYDVYIGRPSIFGNPYPLSCYTLDESIAHYTEYFYIRIKTDEEFRKAVEGLRGKKLGCYCKPKKCHGDVIINYLNEN